MQNHIVYVVFFNGEKLYRPNQQAGIDKAGGLEERQGFRVGLHKERRVELPFD